MAKEKVQKVSVENVSEEVKSEHAENIKSSVFTERVILSLFAVVLAVCACIQAYFQYENNKLASDNNKLASMAAAQTKEVAKTLDETTKVSDEKLDGLTKISKANHKLLNSDSLITKRLLAQVSRWKANETNDPNHIRAAEDAEKDVRESEAKQKEVDQP